jgi:hypothetical protein
VRQHFWDAALTSDSGGVGLRRSTWVALSGRAWRRNELLTLSIACSIFEA